MFRYKDAMRNIFEREKDLEGSNQRYKELTETMKSENNKLTVLLNSLQDKIEVMLQRGSYWFFLPHSRSNARFLIFLFHAVQHHRSTDLDRFDQLHQNFCRYSRSTQQRRRK